MDHRDRRERPYHHGDLRRAILDAAERRLKTDGIEGVTIRACARDAGVSPAAPIHHFGSRQALMSALAARGFEQLVARLDDDHAGGVGDRDIPPVIGAYVAFAVSNPKLFDLMWRDGILNTDNEALARARRIALERLQQPESSTESRSIARHRAVRNWSLAHGLATLLLHGRIVKALGGPDTGLETADDFVALAYDPRFADP